MTSTPSSTSTVDPFRLSWIPIVAMLVLTIVALSLITQIDPATNPLQIAGLNGARTMEDHARLAEASLFWGASMVASAATLLALIGMSVWVYINSIAWPWSRAKFIVYLFPVLIVIAFGWLVYGSTSDVQVFGPKWLTGHDLLDNARKATEVANGFTAAAIMMQFLAASSLIVGLNAGRINCETAGARLKLLLTVGAIALVVGVIEIGAVHRLPAAATPIGAPLGDRPTLIDTFTSAAKQIPNQSENESGEAHDASINPLVMHYARSRLEAEGREVSDESARMLAAALQEEVANQNSNQPELMNAIAREWLGPGDRAAWKTRRDQFEFVASHIASYWGIVFTCALILMYAPVAAIIVGHSEEKERNRVGFMSLQPLGGTQKPKPAEATGEDRGAGGDESNGDEEKPARGHNWTPAVIRILLAFSPLLAGPFAEMLASITRLFAGG